MKIGFWLCLFLSTIFPAIAQDKAGSQRNYTKPTNFRESVVSLLVSKGVIQTLVKRDDQKNISSYNLDFSGDTLATTGTFHDYKIAFDNRNFNLGLVYGEMESRGQLNTVLRGSSSALFDNAELTSISTVKSKSVGLFSKLMESRRAETSSNFTLQARIRSSEMTNHTSIKAGILTSTSNTSEKFRTFDLGYSQKLMIDLSDQGELAMNISRDATIFKNSLSSKNYGVSIGYKFQFQKPKQTTQTKHLNEHKKTLRVSILDGLATGSGTFSNNPDQYSGSSDYSAIIPFEPRGLTISRVVDRGDYRQHFGFAHKESKTTLSTLGLNNTFGANNFYDAKYTATVTRDLLVYGHEWGLTDTTFILAGASAGIMKVDTLDQTVSKGINSEKKRSTTVPIGSLLLGLGTRYKINDNVNGFIETRVDYTDGRPFSVSHRLVEITTLLGIELGF